MSVARCRAAIGRATVAVLCAAFSLEALAQPPETEDGSGHIAPAPPAQPMPPMSDQEMDRAMDMHDDPLLDMFKLDQFELAQGDGRSATDWEAEAWIGHAFDKFWLRSEGERASGTTNARIEAFWDHAFASYWDWQLGARHDVGSGPDRNWAAFGVQGIAPYWFEIEATVYVGDAGRTALRLRAQYELLLTQRLILQSEFEANLYGKRDQARGVVDGLSDADLGLRLRYEIRREIAPYVGVVWKRRFGDPDFGGHSGGEAQFLVGLRIWF